MVKSDFFKTMKNTNFFKNYSKPLALLAILIILSIVLFSSGNNYSVENLTPKPNVKVEIILWVGPPGYYAPNEVAQRWVTEFVPKYEKIPNISLGRVEATEFTKYLELDKYPESAPQVKEIFKSLIDVDFTKNKSQLPFVTAFFIGTHEGKAVKAPLGMPLIGKDLKLDTMYDTMNGITSYLYHILYEKDDVYTPPVVPPAAPAAPASAPAPPASVASAIASNSKLPWGK
jgi:hypothetical protein